MKSYGDYVTHLEKLCNEVVFGSVSRDDENVLLALNEQPARKLQQLVSYDQRRESGAFFSGRFWARDASLKFDAATLVGCGGKVIDPACGAGDLLVEVAKNMEITEDFDDTMASWSRIFYGKDLHNEFIMATRARLALTALHKGAMPTRKFNGLSGILKNINQGCGVATAESEMDFSLVMMNPPYTMTDAPKGCDWSSGKTNQAAVFFHDYVLRSKLGTRILALLPEVLRSGARYERWRNIVGQKIRVDKITSLGQFEPDVDVNIFLIDAVVVDNHRSSVNWNYPVGTTQNGIISDLFRLSIGTVVDFRDPQDGPIVPYIISRNLPKWSIVEKVSHTRQYSKKLVVSPFVVVRRTSRPDDPCRAVATIIMTDDPVAVDNHLIVLEPKDQKLETCQALLIMLNSSWANDWLNERIRCRHLTISSIAEMPLGKP